MQQQRGFTLTELMIVLAIAGVLVSTAVPSFKTMVTKNRLSTNVNGLVGEMQLSRSEGAKRSRPVIVCASQTPNASGATCNGVWTQGWFSYVDNDSSGGFNTGDVVLRRHDALGGSITVVATANTIGFNTDGSLNSANAFRFRICDTDLGTSEGRQVDVSLTGRPSLTSGNIASCSSVT